MIPAERIIRLARRIIEQRIAVGEDIERFAALHDLDAEDIATVWRIHSGEDIDNPREALALGRLWTIAAGDPNQDRLTAAIEWTAEVLNNPVNQDPAQLIVLGVRSILEGRGTP